MTFAIPTTTLPIDSRLLTAEDLGGKWESAGKIDYQSVYGDQPQRCFYDMDQLDGGANDVASASFKVGNGAPAISQVVFSYQPGAAEAAVSTVANALDACGSFSIPTAAGAVNGSIIQSKVDLRGLADAHVYSIDYHAATQASKGMILIGRDGDSVLLVLLGTGSTAPEAELARQAFQLTIDKFVSGRVHDEDRITA